MFAKQELLSLVESAGLTVESWDWDHGNEVLRLRLPAPGEVKTERELKPPPPPPPKGWLVLTDAAPSSTEIGSRLAAAFGSDRAKCVPLPPDAAAVERCCAGAAGAVVLVRLERDGSFDDRNVRKLMRSLKKVEPGSLACGKTRFAVALLGGATCESSAKMMADEIFGPGLRLAAALVTATGPRQQLVAPLKLNSELEDIEAIIPRWAAELGEALVPPERAPNADEY